MDKYSEVFFDLISMLDSAFVPDDIQGLYRQKILRNKNNIK